MPHLLVVFLFFTLTLTSALGEEIFIYKVSKKDTNKFLIKKTPDMRQNSIVKVYNSRNKLKAFAKIERCSKKVCLAKVYKKGKNFKIKRKLRISLVEKQKNQKKRFNEGEKKYPNAKSLSLGIGGGPVSFGYNIGYQDCSLLGTYCLEARTGMVDTSLGSVLVSGQYINLGVHKDIYSSGSFALYVLAEAGFFKSKLNFSEVDSSKYETEENILFSSVNLGIKYSLSKNISIFSSLGYSVNTFEEIYESSSDTYEVGFASNLLILDFGLRYRF